MTPLAPLGPVAPELLGDLPPLSQAFRTAPTTAGTTGFAELFSQALAQVNQSLVSSQVDMQRLATGDMQNLHQVMIRLEENKVSFELMMQVRNRLLEAYQDVMKMQI